MGFGDVETLGRDGWLADPDDRLASSDSNVGTGSDVAGRQTGISSGITGTGGDRVVTTTQMSQSSSMSKSKSKSKKSMGMKGMHKGPKKKSMSHSMSHSNPGVYTTKSSNVYNFNPNVNGAYRLKAADTQQQQNSITSTTAAGMVGGAVLIAGVAVMAYKSRTQSISNKAEEVTENTPLV
jgi:hypothetical protein